jgi:5-methylcytosine-specific restriction endonuclease McrA
MIKKIIDAIQGKAPLSATRSSQWPKVRAEHLKNNPTCKCCGGSKSLEVHHIMPFHLNPTLELEPSNLITLCESKERGINCHLFVGHLGNYQQLNKNVKKDAVAWNKKLKAAKK